MSGKEYIEAIKEGQRKFDRSAKSLVEKLCESYDAERMVKVNEPKVMIVKRISREEAEEMWPDIDEAGVKSNDK